MNELKYNPWTNWPSSGIALVSPLGTLSFPELKAVVLNLELRLRERGVNSTSLVEIQLPDAVAWIASLSLMRIGAASYLSAPGVSPLEPDFVINSGQFNLNQTSRVIGFEKGWLDLSAIKMDNSDNSPDLGVASSPNDGALLRVILTSGTSGKPKGVGVSFGQLQRRFSFLQSYWADAEHELNLMGLASTGGFYSALAAFVNGSTYYSVLPFSELALERVLNEPITLLSGSPVQIKDFIQALAAKKVTMPHLKVVRMAGATAPAALLAELERALPNVVIDLLYGSTEGGGVARRFHQSGTSPQNVGTLISGVELEIQRENGEMCRDGEVGLIRYKTPGLIADYQFQPEESQKSFRDGWFYPGDYGYMNEAGELVLSGRETDLINLGGDKVNLADIDQAARDFNLVEDAAGFVIEDPFGLPKIGLAVVGNHANLRALDVQMRKVFVSSHPSAYIRVEKISTNANGKIDREALLNEYLASKQN